MYDNQTGGQNRSVCRLNLGLFVCCTLMVGVLLFRNNAYANTDEFANIYRGESANVNVDADNGSLAVQNLGDFEVVEANDKESKAIDIHPASSDIVQLDASQGDQNSRLDLAGSQDMQSVDVVDTAAAVKFTHTADDVAGSVADQQANVELGDMPMADLNGDMIEQHDEQLLVADAGTNLPVTNTADAHSQLNDVSNDVTSEDAGLPYAVVLALLALIGLVAVARRNDHHHV